MLKPIIQQMKLRTESRLREAACLITILSNHHRSPQPSSNQQGLVTEIPRLTARVHLQHSTRLSPVSTRKHIEVNASRLQEFTQQNDKRSFPRAPGGEIAHADHGPLQRSRAEQSAPVTRVPQP